MRLECAETKLASSSHESRQELKNGDTVPQDIGTILKLSSRLQDTINFNNELKSENKKLKKVVKKGRVLLRNCYNCPILFQRQPFFTRLLHSCFLLAMTLDIFFISAITRDGREK